MNAKYFINFTSEAFEHKFDGKAYRFAPGEERILETYKAEHFAKHLIDRELQKAGAESILDPMKRRAMYDKCVKDVEASSTDSADMPDEDKAFEVQVKNEIAKKKGGRPKKEVAPVVAPSEPEFEGLDS